MVALQVPLSWIRDIRKLAPTNFLANGLILYGLLTCLGFALHAATHDPVVLVTDAIESNINDASKPTMSSPWQLLSQHWSSLKPFADGWFLFIGTSVLLFEGSITLLVPLQEAVHKPQDRTAFPNV